MGENGIIYLHKPIIKLLDRFTLLPPHGNILGQIQLEVFLVFPFVLEGIFKGLIVYNRVVWKVCGPFYCLSSKALGKQFDFHIIMVYLLQVCPV